MALPPDHGGRQNGTFVIVPPNAAPEQTDSRPRCRAKNGWQWKSRARLWMRGGLAFGTEGGGAGQNCHPPSHRTVQRFLGIGGYTTESVNKKLRIT
jgi:hypothetical protein